MARIPYVDPDICISCEICITNLPNVFQLGAHGKAECIDPNGASEEDIQSLAIDVCPVACISWK